MSNITSKNMVDEFLKYLDFLYNNPNLDTLSIADSFDHYKVFLADEKHNSGQYYDEFMKIDTFKSNDMDNVHRLILDWYVALKTTIRQTRQSRDPYFADPDFLNNVLLSFGIDHPDLVLSQVKPDFALDVINMYKKKGTVFALRKLLEYFFLTPNEIFEFWLEKRYDYSSSDFNLFFVGKCARKNFTTNSIFDFELVYPFDSITASDPHWYYTKQDVLQLLGDSSDKQLRLPSLTPYIKVVFGPSMNFLLMQYMQLERTAHYTYNYYLNGGNLDTHFRLLDSEYLDEPLTLMETMMGFSYLYNIGKNRAFLNDKDGRYVYTHLTRPANQLTEYNEIDLLTRKFEYDYLKAIWAELKNRPQLTNATCTQHGFIREKHPNNNNIITNRSLANRIILDSEIKNNAALDFLFANSLLSPNAYLLNSSMCISGGKKLDGTNTYNTNIYFLNGPDLENSQVSTISMPIALHGHGLVKYNNEFYIFGGRNDSLVNDTLFRYNNISHTWDSIAIDNLAIHNFQYYQYGSNVIIVLGYDSDDKLVKKIKVIDDVSKVIDIDISEIIDQITGYNEDTPVQYTFTEKLKTDSSMNSNGLLTILFEDNKKLLTIKLIDNGKIQYSNFKYTIINLPETFPDEDHDIDYKCSKVFLRNNDGQYIMTKELCIVNNIKFDTDGNFSNKISIYKLSNEITILHDCIKVQNSPLNTNFYLLFGQIDDNPKTNNIQYFTFKNIPTPSKSVSESNYEYERYNTQSTNSSGWTTINTQVKYYKENRNNKAKKIYTFDSFVNYSNRRSWSEKYRSYINTFTDKAPNYWYRDLFVNAQTNTVVQKLGIEETEQKLLYSTNDILTFLNTINPQLVSVINKSILSGSDEITKLLIHFANLMDLYIKLYWKDASSITQLVLTSSEKVDTLVNEFKPIHTRFLGFATVMDFADDWTNSIYADEYVIDRTVQYSEDVIIDLKEQFALPTIIQYSEDYYCSPSYLRYDLGRYNKRSEYFDMQKMEIVIDDLKIYSDIGFDHYIMSDNFSVNVFDV